MLKLILLLQKILDVTFLIGGWHRHQANNSDNESGFSSRSLLPYELLYSVCCIVNNIDNGVI